LHKGHALGLEHSPRPEAMMYFAVTGHIDELKLSKDDKEGIQVKSYLLDDDVG